MDENTIRLFGSKKTDHWQTPPELYKKLDAEFRFDFDPCPLNAQQDALDVDFRWGKRNFVNPPYSKLELFLIKANQELTMGNADLCVFLVFANTDTNWFHNFIYKKKNVEIRFLRGRVKFHDMNGKKQNSAMRPSMLVIMRRND